MAFHKKHINKGVIGEFSKVREEFEELEDAFEQKDMILMMVELADLYGAIEEFAGEKFGITMSDIKSFSDKTKSMYVDGKWSKNA